MNRTSSPQKIETIPSDYYSDWASEEVLDLPPFNRWGCLPEGIHDACFEGVIQRFAFNAARKNLCNRLQKFLLLVIDSNSCSFAHLNGEFISDKSNPKEVDVILQIRSSYGPEAFQAIEPLLAIGLDAIHEKYSVKLHFWAQGFPKGVLDFRSYLDHISPQEASALGFSKGVAKGIVRIAL